jgi:hypothetical protein
MSVYKNKDGKTVRRAIIPKGVQWTWWAIEMIESPAYRVLSLSGHRVIARIRLELARHGGNDNGKLIVTFDDFHEYGLSLGCIAPAIREAEALGFIRVTQYGVASTAEFRIPTKFALTHLPVGNAAPTNDWNRIQTVEEAEQKAMGARKQPSRYGRFPRKKRAPRTYLRCGNRSQPGYENRIQSDVSLDTKTVSLSPTETGVLSISRVDAESVGSNLWTTPSLTELLWSDYWQQIYDRAVLSEPAMVKPVASSALTEIVKRRQWA